MVVVSYHILVHSIDEVSFTSFDSKKAERTDVYEILFHELLALVSCRLVSTQ